MFKEDIKILNGTDLSYEIIGKEIDKYIEKIKQDGKIEFYINNKKHVLICEKMKSMKKFTCVSGEFYE